MYLTLPVEQSLWNSHDLLLLAKQKREPPFPFQVSSGARWPSYCALQSRQDGRAACDIAGERPHSSHETHRRLQAIAEAPGDRQGMYF